MSVVAAESLGFRSTPGRLIRGPDDTRTWTERGDLRSLRDKDVPSVVSKNRKPGRSGLFDHAPVAVGSDVDHVPKRVTLDDRPGVSFEYTGLVT